MIPDTASDFIDNAGFVLFFRTLLLFCFLSIHSSFMILICYFAMVGCIFPFPCKLASFGSMTTEAVADTIRNLCIPMALPLMFLWVIAVDQSGLALVKQTYDERRSKHERSIFLFLISGDNVYGITLSNMSLPFIYLSNTMIWHNEK